MIEDEVRRKLYFEILQEIDDVTMLSLKYLLKDKELSDLENFISHTLNTILENNRVLVYGLTRNFNMTAGSALRNLLENWANIGWVLRDSTKKEKYAAKITKTAFEYAETLNHFIKQKVTITDLANLPKWTNSSMIDRIRALDGGAEFQYELLSRYTHTDMWAAINDEMVPKNQFWTSLLGWGLEFSMETLLLARNECDLSDEINNKIEKLNKRLTDAIAA